MNIDNEIEKELANLYSSLYNSQESLGKEFSDILYTNLDNLYIKDKKKDE